MRRPFDHYLTAAAGAALVWFAWVLGLLAPLERIGGDLVVRSTAVLPDRPAPFAAVLVDDRSLAELGPLPWPRERLAVLVAQARQAGASGVVLDLLLAEPRPGDAALAAALAAGPSVLAATLDPAGSGWVAPTAELGGLDRAAHAHAELDRDGVTRVIASSKQAAGVSLPAMAVVTAHIAGWSGLPFAGTPLRPDFRTTPDEITRVSAVDLLTGADATALDGRVVLIGVTASAAGDQMVTPVCRRGRPTPGVLVHAATAAAIVSGRLLATLLGWQVLGLALAVAALVAELRRRRGRLSVGPLAAAALAIAAAAVAGAWWLHLLLPVATLLTTLIAATVALAAADAAATARQVDRILADLVADGPPPPGGGLGRRLGLVLTLQEQLRHDRDLRRSLMDGLEEGVALLAADGTPLLANRACERLWGGPCRLADLSATASPVERGGRRVAVDLRPFGDGHLALLRDVTAAVELERQRREMQRLVSHELKTPLASLAGFGATLERYRLSDGELLSTAGLIRREAERLGAMVRAFLDLERLDDDARVAVDLAALVAERCTVLAAAAGARSIELRPTTEPAVVRGVASRLTQVVDNLVGNAVNYAPTGSEVRVATRTVGAAVLLEVGDDGPGIPAAAQPHLFERFYRVPGSPPGGSGLGLALVAEAAARHGGAVAVASAPGAGTVFTVTLPAATDEESQPCPSAS